MSGSCGSGAGFTGCSGAAVGACALVHHLAMEDFDKHNDDLKCRLKFHLLKPFIDITLPQPRQEYVPFNSLTLTVTPSSRLQSYTDCNFCWNSLSSLLELRLHTRFLGGFGDAIFKYELQNVLTDFDLILTVRLLSLASVVIARFAAARFDDTCLLLFWSPAALLFLVED